MNGRNVEEGIERSGQKGFAACLTYKEVADADMSWRKHVFSSGGLSSGGVCAGGGVL